MTIEVNDSEEMVKVGEKIGRRLNGGEFIELIGDVGAGKTTFVKGLAKGMGIDEYIQSPSFTISRVYDGRDGLKLYHYDFYRLESAGIMADELSEASGDDKGVVVIEWADTVKDLLPKDRLAISIITTSSESRKIDFISHPLAVGLEDEK